MQLEMHNVVCRRHHTLVLTGELEIVSAPELEAMVRRLIAGGVASLVLDLSGLTFIDSRGVHALLAAEELSRRDGYELSLLPGPHTVQRLFELAEVSDRLSFESDYARSATP